MALFRVDVDDLHKPIDSCRDGQRRRVKSTHPCALYSAASWCAGSDDILPSVGDGGGGGGGGIFAVIGSGGGVVSLDVGDGSGGGNVGLGIGDGGGGNVGLGVGDNGGGHVGLGVGDASGSRVKVRHSVIQNYE